MSRIQIIPLLLLLLSPWAVDGQSIFDVHRDSNEIVTPIEVIEKEVEPPPVGLKEEIEEEQQVIPVEEEYNIEEEAIEPVEEVVSPVETDASNPFEVDHIPIRKNQFKKATSSNPTVTAAPKVTKTENISKNDIKTLTPLLVLFLSGLLLGIVLFNNRKIISDLRMAIFNRNISNSFRGRFGEHLFLYISMLYLVFAMNVSLFINLILDDYINYTPYISLLLGALFVMLLYVGRHLILLIVGWIFELDAEAQAYSFVIMIMNLCIGLLLIPVNLFIAFGPDGMMRPLAYLGIAIIILFFVFRYFRFFLIGSNYLLTRSFQFFLYFCTFEIAPLLIILYSLNVI